MTFIDNKYSKWYYQIINDRKNRQDVVDIVEKHHIIPKSLGGTDDKSNIISLTPREHFVCHLLLTKMTKGENKRKMCWAFHYLTFTNQNDFYSSKEYEKARRNHIESLKTDHHSKRIPGWNERMSKIVKETWKYDEDRRNKHSERIKRNIEKRKKEDPINYTLQQTKAAKAGAAAIKEKCIKNRPNLEYKGKYYKGWDKLKEETGVSKHLYKKYYKNGIDPEYRIGKNGPIKSTSTTQNG